MTYRIFCFLKFFEREEWADDFMQGKLYCNTLQYFRDREEADDQRGDPLEGAVGLMQPDKVAITISLSNDIERSVAIKPEDIVGPITIHTNENLEHNVFCLYAIYTDDSFVEFSEEEITSAELFARIASVNEKLKLHEDCFTLGTHAVLIYSVEQFMRALESYELRTGIRLRKGRIKYYDERSFHGEFKAEEAIFSKQKKYAHQKEYRIAFRTNTKSVFTLNIGSMESYAKKLTIEEARDLAVTIAPKDA